MTSPMPIRTLLVLGVLLCGLHSHAQIQLTEPKTEASGEVQYPDPLRLADGWWDLLEVDGGLNADLTQQWTMILQADNKEATPEVSQELTQLLDNLAQLTQSGKADKTDQPEQESPATLAALLAVNERRYELEQLLEAAIARGRLDRSLATDAEIRVNRARQAYIESSPEAEDRALLGYRWIRQWSQKQLKDRQQSASEASIDRLRDELDQAEEWSTMPVSKLTYGEADEEYWAKAVIAGQAFLDQPFVSTAVSGEMPLGDTAKSADAYAQRVDAQVARQALWLVRNYRGAEGEPTAELTTNPTAIMDWQKQAERLLNDRRARVISAIDGVGSNAATNKELQRQLEEIRKLGAALRGLDVSLEQYALLKRQIEITTGLSLKSVSTFWSNANQQFSAFTDNVLSRTLFHLEESPVTGGMLLRMLLIFLVFWGLSKLIGRAVRRLERRRNISAAAVFLFNRLLHYILILVGALVALSSIGIDLTKFTLFASALGIGLGFGLQAVISNFVSGLIILFERSLKIGDFVELESGVRGKVREINTRGTIVTTNDNIDILIPNSEFVNGKVTNWTLRDVVRRLRIPFGVAYGSDKEVVKKAVLEAAHSVPFTLEDESHRTQVWLSGFGDSSLDFQLIVWVSGSAVSRPSAVSAAYAWAIETALCKYGIEIPFPQRDLNVRTFFGLSGKAAIDAAAGRTGVPVVSEPQPATLTYRERRELGSNDAAEETLRAIAQDEQEKAEAEKAEDEASEKDGDDPAKESAG